MSNFKSLISNLHTNLSGKNISKRIVVIESDDWGAIRVPSKESINRLKARGLDLTKNAYTRFDGLETNYDVELLLEILNKHKDNNGNHPVLTANFVTCNPDFSKIKQFNFEQYFNQKISLTYDTYSNSDRVLDLILSAKSSGLIKPQFHGREHVNVEDWILLLKTNNPFFRLAFEEGISGLGREIAPQFTKNIQATYDTLNNDFAIESVSEGLYYFEEIFGYKSSSFIPNNFIFCSSLLPFIKKRGINVIQGMKYLLLPRKEKLERHKVLRKNGRMNDFGQINIVRNCSYEPSETGKNYLSTLKEIDFAFRLNQPAVISSHRLNFTSRISVKNRDKNLLDFEQLIKSILKKWPDVLFCTTLQLADIYQQEFNEK